MKATARDTDAVARLGGDEFVVVLPDTGWQGALTFAERIRRRVDEYDVRPPRAVDAHHDLGRRRAGARHRSDLGRRRLTAGSGSVAVQARRPGAATGSSLDVARRAPRWSRWRPRGRRARASRRSPCARRCSRPITLSEQLGAEVWIKPEMLQRGGAFKFRGAYNFLAQLGDDERARGVVAPSSGNHAQAVALAARLFGVPGDRRDADDGDAGQARRRRAARRAHRARRDDDADRLGSRRRARGATKGSRSCRRTTIRGSSRGRARSDSRSPRTCRTSARCSCPSAAAD